MQIIKDGYTFVVKQASEYFYSIYCYRPDGIAEIIAPRADFITKDEILKIIQE